jgi:carboxyl-terminal processing protease
LAQQQKRQMQSAGDLVSREQLDALYADLVARKVAPPRAVFDSAAPWIARSVGYELTRQAFGSDAEFMRRTQDDAALQRASQILTSARTPRDVFGNLERRAVSVPATP